MAARTEGHVPGMYSVWGRRSKALAVGQRDLMQNQACVFSVAVGTVPSSKPCLRACRADAGAWHTSGGLGWHALPSP